jgi:hypothetical protein
VRLDTTAETIGGGSTERRTRAIAPSDADFATLYGLCNDAESINRGIDDSLYLRRAHSVGHARQLVDLLGSALMVNSLAVHRHRYRLSYRDVEKLLAECGIEVDHVTIYRWVQHFTPLLVEAARPCRHAVGDRWLVDETYVQVAGVWRYLYPASRAWLPIKATPPSA